MRFKWYIAIVLLSLFGALSVFSQNGGKIQLTGSVTSVTPVSRKFDNKTYDYFDVDLYLQFRNLTDRRLIILKPDSFLGTFTKGFPWGETRLSFIDSLKTVEADFFLERYWRENDPTHSNYDSIGYHINDLATPEPNPSYFAKIDPMSYYECHLTLSLDNGYKRAQTTGGTPTEAYTIAVPEYREFKLKYFLSTKKFPGKVDLRSAQQKWKKFGELVLDSDGDYSIESDIFQNKPSD